MLGYIVTSWITMIPPCLRSETASSFVLTSSVNISVVKLQGYSHPCVASVQPIVKMNLQADMFIAHDRGGGERMDHYWLPGGSFYDPARPEGLGI